MSRKTSKRIVLYQKFIDASNRIADPSWKEVFRKLAYGKPLRGFVITEETLTFRRKKKVEDVIQIPEKLDDEKIKEIKQFISKYSGFRSTMDLIEETKTTMEVMKMKAERISNMEWKKLKKNKKLLQMLGLEFIKKEKEEKKLNKEELKNLCKTIILGFVIDAFDGFEFDDNDNIISINGLEFDEEERVYYFTSGKLNIFEPEKTTKTNSNSQESSENSEFLLTPECLRIKKINIMKSWCSKKGKDKKEKNEKNQKNTQDKNQEKSIENKEDETKTENSEINELSSEINERNESEEYTNQQDESEN